jgi:hypothetical protein
MNTTDSPRGPLEPLAGRLRPAAWIVTHGDGESEAYLGGCAPAVSGAATIAPLYGANEIGRLHAELAARLRRAAAGRAEWRVQDPVSKEYVLAYAEADAGEARANDALRKHRALYPDRPVDEYEVARVVVLDERDKLMLDAANALDQPPNAGLRGRRPGSND